MRLFAANVTTQLFEFHYRVAENPRALRVIIPSGEQRAVGDDMTPFQINGILESNAMYGMYDVDKIDEVPRGKTISLIFSRDKQIPAEIMQEAIAWNKGEISSIGKHRREEMAIAATKILGAQVPDVAERASVELIEEQVGTINRESGDKLEEGYAAPNSPMGRQSVVQSRPVTRVGRKG